ncbi:hypothetical protein HDU76_004243 [Blyttiomyces sp. JEL0837]|nr:hypothetical protein HDU76_004243 [Blyttiomyces sp. JEL0837]
MEIGVSACGFGRIGVISFSMVANRIQPRYHFGAAAGVFFEREPYRNVNGVAHVTRFIGLGEFGAKNKERWFYAFNLVPMTKLEPAVLAQAPSNTTDCPLFSSSNKRQFEDDSNASYFWNDKGGKGGADRKKRNQKKPGHWIENCPQKGQQQSESSNKAPPEGYVCNICKEPGHWIRDCPQKSSNQAGGHGGGEGSLEGYVCRICGAAGQHKIRDCPQKGVNPNLPERDKQSCWFCLSNPNLEKHLLVNIGEEAYIALAKGGLSTWGGHVLIIPMGHYASSRALREVEGPSAATAQEAIKEMDEFKESLKKAYLSRDEVPVMFEVFAGGDSMEVINKLQHMHIQVIPIPSSLSGQVADYFANAAGQEGLDILDGGILPDDPNAAYLRIELPDGNIMVLTPNEERKRQAEEQAAETGRAAHVFNRQLGRLVIADLLGHPDRGNWKRCVLPMEEEKEQTLTMRKMIVSS